MNIYIRYFNFETLVYNVDEALDFLRSIHEINVDAQLEAEVRSYVASDMFYPKRYKVRPRVYFIMIKTTAQSMADFKAKKALNPMQNQRAEGKVSETPDPVSLLNEVREGWYEAQLDFKRVVQKAQTGKFEYKDTHVVYQLKAVSGMDCYNRVIDYLSTRVDSRSQFPSVKGKNYHFKFLGKWK